MTGFNNSPLTGTAGELRYVKSISYESQQIEENETDISFAGYAITSGEDSDLNISSIKITLRLSAGVASDRLNKYAKTISVFCNGAKVGVADVSSFAKSGDTYTKTISLSGATIESDSEVPLFLAVDTVENIDSSNTDNTWAVTLSQVRYTDAGGANMTDSATGSIGIDGEVLFHFLPVANDDE
jgi:hypothetical protein